MSEALILVGTVVLLIVAAAFIVSLFVREAPRRDWCRACGAEIEGDVFYCGSCQAVRDQMIAAAQTAREQGLEAIRQRYAGTKEKARTS